MKFSLPLLIVTLANLLSGYIARSLDEDFQVSKRVYGGTEAKDRPYYISLKSTFCEQLRNENCIGEKTAWCGASLISKNEFVTAKHCLDERMLGATATAVSNYWHLGCKRQSGRFKLLLRQDCDIFGQILRRCTRIWHSMYQNFYDLDQPAMIRFNAFPTFGKFETLISEKNRKVQEKLYDLAIGKLRNDIYPKTSRMIPLCEQFILPGPMWIAGRGNILNWLIPLPYLMEIQVELNLHRLAFNEVEDQEDEKEKGTMIITQSVEKDEGVCRGDSGGGLVTVPKGGDELCLLGVVLGGVRNISPNPQLQLNLGLEKNSIRDFVRGDRHHFNSKYINTFYT